jgi:hypothetical protein
MNKRQVVIYGAVLLFSLVYLTARAQGPVNVAGTWTSTHSGQNGGASTLKITQDGSKITGTLKPDNGWEMPVQNGTVSANTIEFVVPRQGFNGEAGEHYKGTVDGDTMKGTCTIGQNTLEWSAKRSKS